MRTIALTGGIATGKSTVARLLAQRGATIIDADLVAREIVAPGSEGLRAVRDALGAGVLDASGALDRAAVADIIFRDPGARARLEEITHPRIRRRMAEYLAKAMDGAPPLIVMDIPLLFESKREAEFADAIMVVYTPPELQRSRLGSRDGLDEDGVEARLRAQLPIASKRDGATWVIDNSGSREQTAEQVERWWGQVVEGS